MLGFQVILPLFPHKSFQRQFSLSFVTYLLKCASSSGPNEKIDAKLSLSLGPGKRARLLIASAWGLSVIFSLPAIFINQETIVRGHPQCWINLEPWQWQMYITLVASSLFFIPAIIITACYSIIVSTIWRKGRSMGNLANYSTDSSSVATTVYIRASSGGELHPFIPRLTSTFSLLFFSFYSTTTITCSSSPSPSSYAATTCPSSFLSFIYPTATESTTIGSSISKPSDQESDNRQRVSSRGVIPQAKIKSIKMTLVIVFGKRENEKEFLYSLFSLLC